jgi:hypothetical protein
LEASKQQQKEKRMKKLYLAIALALATMVVTAGAAFAIVTFDPESGTGFVGKGDVQLAFGWNDKQLQQNASSVTFSYDATENYEAVCTFITGEGTRGEKTHNVARERSSQVNSVIEYEKRTNPNSKITGFRLTGLGTTTESGEVPVVGGTCPGGGPEDGTWTSVTLVSSSGGLFVHFPGKDSVLLQ